MMHFFKSALFQTRNYKQLCYNSRLLATLYKQEYIVVPFCNIKVSLPINVSLSTLDVHQYKDCDRVIISVHSYSDDPTNGGIDYNRVIQCNHDKENVNIMGHFEKESLIDNVVCKIQAPIKANLDITTERNGNIMLSNFNGETIFLKSAEGNISASKCHCNKISISSSSGNIACASVMQAGDIYLKTQKYGTVSTGRLQGLNLKIETENGEIKTESSYCDKSVFVSERGNLNLRNAHKTCEIIIKKKADLNLTAFDGTLNAVLNDGNANIRLSRILGKSEIKTHGNGLLQFKLSETCLQETCFKINAKDVVIDKDINDSTYENAGESIILNKKDEPDFVINGENAQVQIQPASFLDMFNLKSV